MKNRFDHVVPETPASFHDSLERALRATAERERRSVRLRPAALIAAALALVLAGAALGSAMITVGVERWLFRRGECRRAQGVRFAHTRQGLALGALEAGLTALTFGAGAVRERLSKG